MISAEPAIAALETKFEQLVSAVQSACRSDEQFTLELVGEQSQFLRFNRARVRQSGMVEDKQVRLTWMHNQRSSFQRFPFTGHWDTDWQQTEAAIAHLRTETAELPIDPYLVLPSGDGTSKDVHAGDLLAADAVPSQVLADVAGLDFTGIYAGGSLIRAYADSAGKQHWFSTETFALDYSLFAETGQAVKGTFAGSHWNRDGYAAKIAESKRQLQEMARSLKTIPKGQYRTYLAPSAVADLVNMFSWGGVSEAALQQGSSALNALRRQEKQLSSLFNLHENFGRGLVPRFNSLGEIAPIDLPLIQNGALVNTLVNSRTAKEYGKTANGANSAERLRSPEVSPGSLAAEDILKALDTGLYLSNLHYLNWSDRPAGRVTGMTRYACFWVENGEIVAPIENLRFDESLYHFFGDRLLALTEFQEFIPEVGTYDNRSLGGVWVPGAIVEAFTYTL